MWCRRADPIQTPSIRLFVSSRVEIKSFLSHVLFVRVERNPYLCSSVGIRVCIRAREFLVIFHKWGDTIDIWVRVHIFVLRTRISWVCEWWKHEILALRARITYVQSFEKCAIPTLTISCVLGRTRTTIYFLLKTWWCFLTFRWGKQGFPRQEDGFACGHNS